jgi:hypothetical protein
MSNTQQLRGAIHLHTTLSHDGALSLEQLVDLLKKRGHSFIAITEHSYDIDDLKMVNLVKQSDQLSSPGFLIIPGLEFRCHDDIDILGYGVFQTCDSDDPATIITHIHNHGGVAVLAHPTLRDYPIEKEWVMLLDGAEFWNRQEGKYLPQIKSIRRFRQFRKWHRNIKAFLGLDLHRAINYYPISILVNANNNNRETILLALKQGDFESESPLLKLNSDGQLGWLKLTFIFIGNAFLNTFRLFDEFSLKKNSRQNKNKAPQL